LLMRILASVVEIATPAITDLPSLDSQGSKFG
jgi:hypothetical protein